MPPTTEEDVVTTDLSFEHMLSFLLGKKRFHGACGHLSAGPWRRQLIHIFETLEKAVRQTLQGDEWHRQQIEERCRLAVAELSRLRNTGQISVAAIENLTYVAFLLIGEWPDNWNKSPSVAAHSKNWHLTSYRTLHYLRSPEQRVRQIIALSKKGKFVERLPSTDELYDRLDRTHKGDAREFLNWFKQDYKDIYLELE